GMMVGAPRFRFPPPAYPRVGHSPPAAAADARHRNRTVSSLRGTGRGSKPHLFISSPMDTPLPATLLVAALCLGCGSPASDQPAPDGGATGRDAGVCTGAEMLCLGVCVDTATDGDNCGTCGHSCGGGACAASLCHPLALAPPPSPP